MGAGVRRNHRSQAQLADASTLTESKHRSPAPKGPDSSNGTLARRIERQNAPIGKCLAIG
jgi:hypothetical protein